MIETVFGAGMTVVGIVQVAIFVQTRQLNAKVDKMVTDSQCQERRAARDKQMDSCRKEVFRIERNLGHHVHNGAGVKFFPGE
jgi:hypothetical protein